MNGNGTGYCLAARGFGTKVATTTKKAFGSLEGMMGQAE